MDARIGRQLFDGRTPLPAFVLRETALAHDIDLLAAYTRERGVSFAPHGKTPMAPAIFRRQVDAGAWAITVATTTQAAVALEAGVDRVLIANEVVDDEGIAWLAGVLDRPAPDLFVLVDSVAGVRRMADRLHREPDARATRRRLPVLIDVGVPGGRTGVRTVDEAEAVAAEVGRRPELTLAGVSIYEGVVGGASPAEREAAVRVMCATARAIVERLSAALDQAPTTDIIVSGGGSQYLDVVIDELARPWSLPKPVRVVVRSGAYVAHDHGLYERASPFGSRAAPGAPRLEPAIEVWAAVVSAPEPGLAIAGAGRRDLPIDADLPVVIKRRGDDGIVRRAGPGFRVLRLNDQHAFIEVGADELPLAVGELVAFGISHPCTAFQLWREALVVDEDDRILDVYELRF